MGMKNTDPESIETFKLRDLGNSYGFTVSMHGLEKLGLVNKEGELIDGEIKARSTVFEDGTITYEIPLEEIQNKSLSEYSD